MSKDKEADRLVARRARLRPAPVAAPEPLPVVDNTSAALTPLVDAGLHDIEAQAVGELWRVKAKRGAETYSAAAGSLSLTVNRILSSLPKDESDA